MILYINACVRRESRTQRLAGALLQELGGEVQEVRLEDMTFGISDEAFLDFSGVLLLFFWAPKSLQMVTAAIKLKDAYSLEGKL